MDYNRLAFFGDSWVAGCEANELDGSDAPEFAFPSYFPGSLNLGISGNSNDYLVSQLVENLQNIETAVFCLTDPSRRYWTDDNGNWVNGQISCNLSDYLQRCIFSLSNDTNDDLITSQACLLLYLICKTNNIQPYFINMFGGQHCESKFWDIIPESVWLLPKDKCIVQQCFDTVNWFVEYPLIGDFSVWLKTNNKDVINYIRPCDAHPNKLGHKVIAEFIGNKLNDL